MGANSKIEWTDHTASPWYGCAHREFEDGSTHPGCQNCYAEAMSSRNPHTLGVWGTDGVRVKSKSFIANLRKWNREAQAAGKVVSVFPSLCDPFEDRPELEPWRREMFAMLDECQFVRLLLLTKRPENVRRMWLCPHCHGRCHPGDGTTVCPVCDCDAVGKGFRANVWLGTSVSNQETADRLVPELLKCRGLAPVLFLSAEPLLGPIHDRGNALFSGDPSMARGWCWGDVDWVIGGGESGPKARPMHPDWARSLRDQCQAAGVPFFWKQWGEWHSGDGFSADDRDVARQGFVCPAGCSSESVTHDALLLHSKHCRGNSLGGPATPLAVYRVGKKAAGRLLDEREWSEFPQRRQ